MKKGKCLTPDLYPRIIAAKRFIDEHYTDELNLNLLAGQAFLSPCYFQRLFRQVYQRTPHQYLTFRRMEKARDLLESDRLVTEVCREVGYESLPSFSHLFKKSTGYAPHFYRNLAAKKKAEQKEDPKRVVPFCFRKQYGI